MENEQRKIVENYVRAYNEFDIEGMLADLHEQVVFENIANGTVNLSIKGRDKFRVQAEAAKSYFTVRQQKITSWDFQDTIVKIDLDYTAELAIDFPNGMKAGEILKLKGKSEFEFAEGMVIRITDRS